MCLGVNLGDAVVLAADGRRTMSSGDRVDDVQKLVKITDTLWSAGAGNLPPTTYLQAVLAERQPTDVAGYMLKLQPFAQKTLAARAELFDTLAGQPGHADHTSATVVSMLLVGGLDPARDAMVLYSFVSDKFEPRVHPQAGFFGGRPQDRQLADLFLGVTLSGGTKRPEDVAAVCQDVLQKVAKENPDIGPTGHVVIVRRTGSELRAF